MHQSTEKALPPSFLIIGAQKCGSSWLHQQLSRHPNILMPPEKELEFFSYREHLKNPGWDQYLSHFAGPKEAMRGEATPSYFWTHSDSEWCKQPSGFQTDIPRVIQHHLGPGLRLILCLRDPVMRAVSAYAHHLAHGELNPGTPFREAAHHGGIIDMGFYARHLRHWHAFFPASQFHLLTLENDIIANPARCLAQTLSFLDQEQVTMDTETLKKPVFPGLARRLDESGDIEIMGAGRVTAADIAWLRDLYRPDCEKLEQMTAQPFLKHWSSFA